MSRRRRLNLVLSHNLGLTLYTLSESFWGFFQGPPRILGLVPQFAYGVPPPPVNAGSSTVTDQSRLSDSMMR